MKQLLVLNATLRMMVVTNALVPIALLFSVLFIAELLGAATGPFSEFTMIFLSVNGILSVWFLVDVASPSLGSRTTWFV